MFLSSYLFVNMYSLPQVLSTAAFHKLRPHTLKSISSRPSSLFSDDSARGKYAHLSCSSNLWTSSSIYVFDKISVWYNFDLIFRSQDPFAFNIQTFNNWKAPPRAVRRGPQMALCAFQFAFWQSRLQYQAVQLPHFLRVVGAMSSLIRPQRKQLAQVSAFD